MDLPAENHTRELQRLAELASQPSALEDVFEGALRSLRALVHYDLAALYELAGDTLKVRAAAGPLVSPEVRKHELSLAKFPTIRQALETRRPIPLDEHHHKGEEGDPYDGVLDLPHGHSCMVVPLFAADRSLGIITLDRTVCGVYDESRRAARRRLRPDRVDRDGLRPADRAAPGDAHSARAAQRTAARGAVRIVEGDRAPRCVLERPPWSRRSSSPGRSPRPTRPC